MAIQGFVEDPLWGQMSHTAQLIEGAKKEGKLVWFTTMAVDTSQPLVNAFLKEYPFIKAELVRATGERIISRILSEAAAGKWSFDVVSGGDVDLLAERNLLLSYVSPESARFPATSKKRTAVGPRFTTIIMCWRITRRW